MFPLGSRPCVSTTGCEKQKVMELSPGGRQDIDTAFQALGVIRTFCGVLNGLTQTLSCKSLCPPLHSHHSVLQPWRWLPLAFSKKQGDVQLLFPRVRGYKEGFMALLPFQTLSLVYFSRLQDKIEEKCLRGGLFTGTGRLKSNVSAHKITIRNSSQAAHGPWL